MDDQRIKMRRKDRAVQDEGWMKDFLRRAPVGVLATVAGGQPFLHTNLFVYDETTSAIYMHSAAQGRTPDNMAANPQVCFTVSEMGRLLPAARSRDFSVEYASVVIFGQARLVSDEAEMKRGLQLIMDKYAPHLRPGEDYPVIEAGELKGLVVYRIEIESWSGKRKTAPEDFPGAYFYRS